MFTGLVQSLGKLQSLEKRSNSARLTIHEPKVAQAATVGDSISVNGCCLTVVEVDANSVGFDAVPETLARTNLGALNPNDPVNLESSLRVGDLLGGHFVTGHIDGLGTLVERIDESEWSTMWFEVPKSLALQMASKGSVAIDGISLTLVDVAQDRFSVAIIPHTLKVTTLGTRRVGDTVNIETDVLAKYVARQLDGWRTGE